MLVGWVVSKVRLISRLPSQSIDALHSPVLKETEENSNLKENRDCPYSGGDLRSICHQTRDFIEL